MADRDQDTIAIQEAYANLYNEIVKPDRVFVATQYFRKKWLPRLGPTLAWVIIALRQHCYWSKETGEKRDWCLISQEELAAEAGISVATLKRLLKQEHADKFIVEISHRYRYDPHKRKQVRKKSRYRLRMDDPLTPEDEALLREKLTQQLAGLKVDPETGQIDMLALLDRLSQGDLADLPLNLSDRSNEPAETRQLDESIGVLAKQISLFLTGSNRSDSATAAAESDESNPYPGSILVSAEDIRQFELAEDHVLLTCQDGYLAVPIEEVVKRDLRMSGGRATNYARTECFFSVAHALGEGPAEDWLPEEEARLILLNRLERELSEQYRQLGAFSLAEALRQYFSPDLAAGFVTGQPDEELGRVREWLIYTRRAKGLKNPAGFLRSRLESGELPPDSIDSTNSSD